MATDALARVNFNAQTLFQAAGGDHRAQLAHLKTHRKFQRQEECDQARIDWCTVISRAQSREHITRHLHRKINAKVPGFNPKGHEAVAAHGYQGHIRRIGEEKLDAKGVKRYPARRWVVVHLGLAIQVQGDLGALRQEGVQLHRPNPTGLCLALVPPPTAAQVLR